MLGASLGMALGRWQLGRWFTPGPAYQVEQTQGRLELRRYEHRIHAETIVVAPWPTALQVGFARLFRYITGDNAEGRALEMTTPVLLSVTAEGLARRATPSWQPPGVTELGKLTRALPRSMVFVMPANSTLDRLPAPNDARVRLHGVPPRRLAALRFRGGYQGDLPAQKRNELLFLLKCAGLRPASEVWFAAYDGPSTLPILRRNEVMVELDD